MTTVINTNLASLFAQNSLSNAQNNLATSVQRLSSGLRINSAKDDAAGLAIAQNMQGQINGVNQSIRNLSDATNLLQTADSSLSTVQDMLLRMKQLAVQGYNGSLNVTQKDALVTEMTNINDEINATAQRTTFNGVGLLSSGTGIDSVTGGISSGKYLTTTAPTFDTTVGSAGMALATTAGSVVSGSLSAVNSLSHTATISYTLSIGNDPAVRDLNGQYTLTANDGVLTLSHTIGNNSQVEQQSIAINPATYDSNSIPTVTSQKLNFDKFGLELDISTSVPGQTGTQTGVDIAQALNGKVIGVKGVSSQITGIDVSSVAAGQYQLAAATPTNGSTASALNMTWTDSIGNKQSETVDLGSGFNFTDNSNSTIKFHNGVKIDLHTFQSDTGANLAYLISHLTDTQGSHPGVLNVTGTNNSTLAFQSGAESSAFININTINVMTGSGGTTGGSATEMTNLGSAIESPTGLTGLSANQADLATWQAQFRKTAALIDTALDWVSTQRSVYGAQMNRLGFISSNLTAGSTNLQNSRSAIMDTDFAAETAKLTKGQIMQQAATAMLAQANQMPNVILSLLK